MKAIAVAALALCAAQVRAEPSARALAGHELRQWHRGDGHRYGVSRAPAYAQGGVTAWPILVNGRRQRTAILVRDGAGGPRVLGMAELAHVRPGEGTLDLFRRGGRSERHDHVVRAQGVFRPTLALVLVAPGSAAVEPFGNARIVGRAAGARRQALLVAPVAAGDLTLTVRSGARTSVVLSPFHLVSDSDLAALGP